MGMIHRLKTNHARADSELMHARNNDAAQKHSRPLVNHGKGLKKKYPRLGYYGDLSDDSVNHARIASKPMHAWKPYIAPKIHSLPSQTPLMQHDRNLAKGYQYLHNGYDHLEDEVDHEVAYDYEDSEEDKEYEVDEYGMLEDDYEGKLPLLELKDVYQKIPNKFIDHH